MSAKRLSATSRIACKRPYIVRSCTSSSKAFWMSLIPMLRCAGDLDCGGDVMGPNLLFHLGGGQGGIQHFMEQFTGPLATWWKDLGKITEFSPEVKQTIIDGVLKEAGNRSIEELERERDAMLLELLATRAKDEKKAQAAVASEAKAARSA